MTINYETSYLELKLVLKTYGRIVM